MSVIMYKTEKLFKSYLRNIVCEPIKMLIYGAPVSCVSFLCEDSVVAEATRGK